MYIYIYVCMYIYMYVYIYIYIYIYIYAQAREGMWPGRDDPSFSDDDDGIHPEWEIGGEGRSYAGHGQWEGGLEEAAHLFMGGGGYAARGYSSDSDDDAFFYERSDLLDLLRSRDRTQDP